MYANPIDIDKYIREQVLLLTNQEFMSDNDFTDDSSFTDEVNNNDNNDNNDNNENNENGKAINKISKVNDGIKKISKYNDENIKSDKSDNYCRDCGIPMEFNQCSDEYTCRKCLLIIKSAGGINDDVCAENSIRINNGNSSRYYGSCSNKELQLKKINSHLKIKSQNNTGFKISEDIIKKAAIIYNEIQNLEVDENGLIGCNNVKKIVKKERGDEIIAALIYFICIQNKTPRKKRDIARFMQLGTEGFSKGEDLVRQLCKNSIISGITVDGDTTEDFIERYLETLNIFNEENKDFVNEFVRVSEEQNLLLKSKISSKVVGSIWILIKSKQLKITAKQLETATDNCRRNTYIKFCKATIDYIDLFKPIYESFNIQPVYKF